MDKELDKLKQIGDSVGMEIALAGIVSYKITPARLREVVQNGLIASGPGEDMKYMPTSNELDTINRMARTAVSRGQVIDFGYWPNEMIKTVGDRSGHLYAQNALGHPFSTPYIFMHSWNFEHDAELLSCAYLVNPFPHANDLCIDFEALIFEPLRYKGVDMLGIGDRVLFHAKESVDTDSFIASVIPFAFRFPRFFNDERYRRMSSNDRGETAEKAAVGNVLNPVTVALQLLNTRNIPQTIVTASEKLNKARLKNNKLPIPPYRVVDSSGYVTAITKQRGKSEYQGGTHASPIMHVRKGHWRHYSSGERSFIRDTLVNASEEMRGQFRRSHYTMKE